MIRNKELNCGVLTMLAGCVQWSIASFIWNVEVTFLPAYKKLHDIQMTMFGSSVKRYSFRVIFNILIASLMSDEVPDNSCITPLACNVK